jgi:RHS repeat-associated protein
VVKYLIDGDLNRVEKLINGTITKKFIYHAGHRVAAELNTNNTLKSVFVYGTQSYSPDYMIQGTKRFRFVKDQLGSIRLVVNVANGNVLQRLDYDEFGKVTQDTNPGFQPFGFAGGLYDPDTKLVRFGARDYDADTGRWTSKDPILFAGGDANLMVYAGNDPVNFVDPSGLSEQDVNNFQNEFTNIVNGMNSNGLRRPGSGLANGILNNLSSSLGSGYLGCQDQAFAAKGILSSMPTDDKWSLTVVPNITHTHYYIEGHSSNPSDPVITIDPWKNSFTRGQ